MHRWLNLLIIGLFVILIQACEDKPCNRTMESLTGVEFYSLDVNNAKTDTIIPYLAVYAPEQTDTMFADSTLRSMKLNLNPEKDETILIFSFGSAYDTIVFEYAREFRLVSQDCGFQSIFNIKNVTATKNAIDSLSLIDPIVDIDDKTHLEIFMLKSDL